MSDKKKEEFSLTAIVGAIVGAASILAVSATPAQALTIDEHGKIQVNGATISEILPQSSVGNVVHESNFNLICPTNLGCSSA